jgi:hypothetical protein
VLDCHVCLTRAKAPGGGNCSSSPFLSVNDALGLNYVTYALAYQFRHRATLLNRYQLQGASLFFSQLYLDFDHVILRVITILVK